MLPVWRGGFWGRSRSCCERRARPGDEVDWEVTSTREKIAQEIQSLTDAELDQLAAYLAFLRFQGRASEASAVDEAQLAALCPEFADEDRWLAEEGLADYAEALRREDAGATQTR